VDAKPKLTEALVVAGLALAIPHIIRDRLAVQQEPAAPGPATAADFAHLPLVARWLVSAVGRLAKDALPAQSAPVASPPTTG
jgi:hypothetical protein